MNLPSWLLYALSTMLLWGIWGFFGKLASRTVTPQNLIILSNIGWILPSILLFVLYSQSYKFNWRIPDFYYALLCGTLGCLGGLFFYFAVSKGEASRVVAVTALYPLVTVILAYFFLREPFTFHKITGVVFALLGIYLLSK